MVCRSLGLWLRGNVHGNTRPSFSTAVLFICVSLSPVLVTSGQPQSKNTKWQIPDIWCGRKKRRRPRSCNFLRICYNCSELLVVTAANLPPCPIYQLLFITGAGVGMWGLQRVWACLAFYLEALKQSIGGEMVTAVHTLHTTFLWCLCDLQQWPCDLKKGLYLTGKALMSALDWIPAFSLKGFKIPLV